MSRCCCIVDTYFILMFFDDILYNIVSCHTVTGLKAIRATLRHLSHYCSVHECEFCLLRHQGTFSPGCSRTQKSAFFSRRAVTSVRLQLSSFRLKAAVGKDVRGLGTAPLSPYPPRSSHNHSVIFTVTIFLCRSIWGI